MSSNDYPDTPSELSQISDGNTEALEVVPFVHAVTPSPTRPPSSPPHHGIDTTSGLNLNSFNVSNQTLRNAYNTHSNHYYYNFNYSFGAEAVTGMRAPHISRTIEEQGQGQEDDEDDNERSINATDLRVANDVGSGNQQHLFNDQVITEGPSMQSPSLQPPGALSPEATLSTSDEASDISPENSRRGPRSPLQLQSGWQKSAATTMSGNRKNGNCKLVELQRKDLRIPHPSISEQAKAFLLADFFWQPYAIPLWKTSPGLISKSDRQKQMNRVTMIGHVGNFNRQGGFEILFNIFKTEQENRENGFYPPANFVPYVPVDTVNLSTFISRAKDYHRLSVGDFGYVQSLIPATDLQNTKHCVYSFRTIETNEPLRGAALPLPDGYTEHRFLVPAIDAMQEYFDEYAPSWYRYYGSIRRNSGLLEGSLKLVTASFTAKICGAATFIKDQSRVPESIYANMCRPNPNEDIYQWHRHDLVSTTTGPSKDEMVNQVADFESQCVAIEVLKIKVKETILSAVIASLSKSLSSLVSKKSK
ncbi:hypothetical protein CPC08DRAFT_770202 [Agrocybe pediades]|nr:hypothetical protein CPC08DRAFT_770202 [Agrocybe pediades]